MNIDKFLNEVNNINKLILELTKSDVESNIKSVSKKIDRLSNRIDRYQNRDTIPYSEIMIDFKNKLTLSVRAADEKVEDIIQGRSTFDVVGWNDEFMVLSKSEWDTKIGLKLTYQKEDTYIEQSGEVKLFYNKYGDLSNGIATRSSRKEDVKFEIIKLVKL
jgi:hypothetical protein